MVVVVIVCLLAVIGLAVALWRFQQHIDALTAERDELLAALDEADNEVTDALTATAAAERQRDEALERVQRARRDASEVAGRLTQETNAREAAERRVSELLAEVGELRESAGGEALAERLWALALADLERTWRMSVAGGPDEVSPLAGADDQLRAAVEIVVDAAREDAGAAVELVWRVTGEVPVADALLVLATVRELVASVAKTASAATLGVDGTSGAVDVRIDALGDDDAPLTIDLAGAVEPGRYRVGSG